MSSTFISSNVSTDINIYSRIEYVVFNPLIYDIIQSTLNYMKRIFFCQYIVYKIDNTVIVCTITVGSKY